MTELTSLDAVGVVGTDTYQGKLLVGQDSSGGNIFRAVEATPSSELVGEIFVILHEYKPTTGSTQFPSDSAGEIRTTGSTYNTGISFTDAVRLEIQFQERTGQRRQWTQILDLTAPAQTVGKPKGIAGPFDTWYITTTVSNMATGQLYFVETNVNANMSSVIVYGKRQLHR